MIPKYDDSLCIFLNRTQMNESFTKIFKWNSYPEFKNIVFGGRGSRTANITISTVQCSNYLHLLSIYRRTQLSLF